MIIIPDVHGRLFWYDAVKHRLPGEKVIFLGDYLDPYVGYEDVTEEQAVEVFIDVINYKDANPDEVILLLGNHDLGYLDREMISCRHDYARHNKIKGLFRDIKDGFQIAYTEKLGDVDYMFTHAGIQKKWLECTYKDIPNDDNLPLDEYLNNEFRNNMKGLNRFLGIYSKYRGFGGWDFASPVWADVREYMKDRFPLELTDGHYHIFGHTRSKEPVITDKFAMLDARCAFTLREENGKNVIKKIEDETV